MKKRWSMFYSYVQSFLIELRQNTKKKYFLRKSFLKYVLLVVGIALLIILEPSKLGAAGVAQNSENQLRVYARDLTTQGHEQLARGKAEAALKFWEEAAKVYSQLGYHEGVIGSRINQSLALQALGQYRLGCKILLTALNMGVNNRVCESSSEGNQTIPAQSKTFISAIGLRNLGEVLRVIGKLDKSENALEPSLKIAKDLQSPSDMSAALLGLGNTKQALYSQKKDLYERTNSPIDRDGAKIIAYQALEYYEQAIKEAKNISNSEMTGIQSQLNHLSLLLNLKQWLLDKKQDYEAEAVESKIKLQITELPQIKTEIDKLPQNQTAVYAKLNLAESLIYLKDGDKFLSTAIEEAEQAIEQAKKLEDRRAEAYAKGILASFYEKMPELSSKAEELTKEALGLAQAIYALDIAYQWQYQLGRIYQANGKIEEAIAAYDAAVTTLDLVRKDLLSINPDVQFSFRDNLEPVYREFLKLLLRPNANLVNIERASQVSGLLQLAEIESFIQCGLNDFVPLEQAEKPPDAIIYPIFLPEPDRLEIIVKLPQPEKLPAKLYRYTTAISQKEFKDNINYLRGRLLDWEIDSQQYILPLAQKLYDWIIRPVAAKLPESGTLVFVLDSNLQNIPMAILHDGERYLVEKYSIAVSLGSQLPKSKSLAPGRWNALLTGISKKAESYPPDLPVLPNVEGELKKIKNIVPSQELLNQKFTIKAFQNQINATVFPVIHIATHGKFSSDPEKTLIYAWDEKIKVKEIDKLLRTRGKISRDPIELLVLSACETASGDPRAALGIAGVALRANARSTVASLWRVSDESTARFMGQFYQELNKENMTKAEALRQVQLSFLSARDDRHPYYWSAFILSGNWL